MSDRVPARLRSIATRRIVSEDRALVEITDALGVAGDPLASHAAMPLAAQLPRGIFAVPENVWRIASAFDGVRDIGAIAQALAEDEASVARVAAGFSVQGLLSDGVFRARATTELASFLSTPERPFVGAGRDYSPDPYALRIRIAGLVANDWDMPASHEPFGVIAPACTIEAAAAIYGRTYAALRHVTASFDRVLVLAQIRGPLDSVLVPLARSFSTPFGAVNCDVDAARTLGVDAGFETLAHRDTLVLERHALFMRVLFPRLSIVPVIVGARASFEDDSVAAASNALERVLALPGRTFVVCACTWSEWPTTNPTNVERMRMRETDRGLVEHATNVDAAEFARATSTLEPALRATLLAPYLLLRLAQNRPSNDPELERVAGTILGYEQGRTREGVVSSASIFFR